MFIINDCWYNILFSVFLFRRAWEQSDFEFLHYSAIDCRRRITHIFIGHIYSKFRTHTYFVYFTVFPVNYRLKAVI